MGDNTLKIALKLLLITLVAGLALGLVNGVTKDPIKQQELIAAENARREVLGAEEFYEIPLDVLKEDPLWQDSYRAITAIYGGIAPDGSFAGAVVELTAKGYGGKIAITVGVSADKKVSGVKVGSHSETPGLGAKTADEKFYGQFAGLEAAEPIAIGTENGVSAVAGATISSKAVTGAADTASKAAASLMERIKEAAN